MTNQYYLTKQSVNEYVKIVEGYNGHDLIEKLKVFLPKHSSILKLGSGPGVDLKILSENYHVTGLDYSQIFLDYIYSNKVLQHLTDDELLEPINRQSTIINNDRLICHFFWAGDDCYDMKDVLHNYHTLEALQDCYHLVLKYY